MEHRPAREFDFELPVGYMDDDGRVHRLATLRKMTGHEEALLADRKLRHNGGMLVTELLASCLRQLVSSADRNYLLLQLRKITFGNELETTYVCPVCGETSHALQDLDELPVRNVNGGGPPKIAVELEDGWEDKDGEIYTTMVFRLPIGTDEEKIASIIRDNPSRGMNALLARCMLALGDMPSHRREALGTKVIGDLTMGDRARIEKTFRREMPDVDLTQEIEYAHCGHSFQTSLDLTSFFSLQ